MNIPLQRLQHQLITGVPYKEPGEVVRHLGAVQAQDYLGSLWAVGLRMPKTNESEIEQAISNRAIIRTWPMRGTLHFVSPEDVRWMLSLLTPAVIARRAGRYRQLELNEKIFTQSRKLFEKALEGGKQLTRPELYEVLNQANISTVESRGFHIIGHLAQQGVVCFGPRRGKQHTLTLLDEWVPAGKRMNDGEALAVLAQRYFISHGPATVYDFAWWSGLKLSDARRGIAMVASVLEEEVINRQSYWYFPTKHFNTLMSNKAYLLPSFDEYTVAYKNRTAVIDAENMKKVNAGGGILKPVMVINGQVVGTWERNLKNQSVVVTMSPFTGLTKAHFNAFSEAAEKYGIFLDSTARVNFSKL